MSSERNAGESAIWSLSGATLCGDRARRVREMQARVRFGFVRGQPSAEIVRVEGAKCRRECDLSGSGATLCGDRACRVREIQARVRFDPVPAQPSAEIVRVERENAGESTIGVQASAEIMQARVRFDPIWRNPCGDRAFEYAAGNLGSWKMRTGDFVATLVRASIWGAGR